MKWSNVKNKDHSNDDMLPILHKNSMKPKIVTLPFESSVKLLGQLYQKHIKQILETLQNGETLGIFPTLIDGVIQ